MIRSAVAAMDRRKRIVLTHIGGMAMAALVGPVITIVVPPTKVTVAPICSCVMPLTKVMVQNMASRVAVAPICSSREGPRQRVRARPMKGMNQCGLRRERSKQLTCRRKPLAFQKGNETAIPLHDKVGETAAPGPTSNNPHRARLRPSHRLPPIDVPLQVSPTGFHADNFTSK